MRRRILVALLVAGCSSAPAPQPAALPAPAAPAVEPAPATLVAPAAVAGSWRLRVEMQSGNRPQPRQRRDPQATMTLAADTAVARAQGAQPAQYAATVTIPGYTRPVRRGRAQTAAWWPIRGDSVVVQFEQGQGSRGDIQLRGAVRGGSLSGEVWYVSNETGSTFQLGSFTATKSSR